MLLSQKALSQEQPCPLTTAHSIPAVRARLTPDMADSGNSKPF